MPGRHYSKEELTPEPPQVLPWDEFREMFYAAHKQGEHIAIVGPNGSGKTMLGLELCRIIGSRLAADRRPSRVVVLQYKPTDATVQKVIPDWPIIKKWPPRYGEEHCVVWPRGFAASRAAYRQRQVFAPLLDQIYSEGGQTVYVPEAAYFERALPNGLSLSGTMEQFWSTARSLKITLISDTQRPRNVTLLMWTEPAWLIIYKLRSKDDLKHVAGLSGREVDVYNVVPKLGDHECMVIRRQVHAGQQAIYVTKVTEVARNEGK
jgi:energy-coupling factor transporter ATP-binding protein EcfA2